MPDFPTAVPTDIPNATVSETLGTMHGGLNHVVATNRILTNIKELATKLGIGISSPGATAGVLRRIATGQSQWGPVAAGDVHAGGGGSANTVLRTTDGTNAVFGKVTQADIDPPFVMVIDAPNPVDNGGFPVWQRGASFASAPNNQISADRWKMQYNAPGGFLPNLSRSPDVPPVAALMPSANYSYSVSSGTPMSSGTAASFVVIDHVIEGYNWLPYGEKQVTVGFWAKSAIPGMVSLALQNAAAGGVYRTCIQTFTILAPSVWEYKTVTFPVSGPVTAANGWNLESGPGVHLLFTLAAGSDYTTATTGWNTGSQFARTGTTNLVTAGYDIKLWGFRLGLGATVAPFWPLPFGDELFRAQRTFQTSYPYGNVPPTATLADITPVNTNSIPTGQYFARVQLKRTMRAAPSTVLVYPYTTVTNTGRVSSDAGADQGANSGATANITMNSFAVANQSGSTISLSQSMVFFGWTASADF